MKNCIWLKPQLVAWVEFTEWTPDGHLRHSKFCGLRDDKDPREVVRGGLKLWPQMAVAAQLLKLFDITVPFPKFCIPPLTLEERMLLLMTVPLAFAAQRCRSRSSCELYC